MSDDQERIAQTLIACDAADSIVVRRLTSNSAVTDTALEVYLRRCWREAEAAGKLPNLDAQIQTAKLFREADLLVKRGLADRFEVARLKTAGEEKRLRKYLKSRLTAHERKQK